MKQKNKEIMENMMNKGCFSKLLTILVLIPFIFAVLSSVSYALYNSLTIRGEGVVNTTTNFLVNGNFSTRFSIYDAFTGGNVVYNSTATVEYISGSFLYELQNMNQTFDADRYLGIAVGGQAEISPRTNLTAVSNAFKTNNSDRLAGQTSGYYWNTTVSLITNHSVQQHNAFPTSCSAGNYVQGLGSGGWTCTADANTFSSWTGTLPASNITSASWTNFSSFNASQFVRVGNNITARESWLNSLYAIIGGINQVKVSANNVTNGTFGPGNYTFDATNTDFFIDDTNGRVGIGTTAPGEKLHIQTTDGSDAGIRTRSNNAAGDPFIQFTTDAQDWYAGVDNSDSDKFMIGSDWVVGTDPHLVIQTTGEVGIGTESPGQKLEVVGNINATQLCIGTDCRSSWPTGSGVSVASGWTNSSTTVYLSNASNKVGIGTSTPTALLEVKQAGAGVFGLNVSNVLYVNDSNVGIGTTSPTQTLNVVGTANITGLCVAENSLISMSDGTKKKITDVKAGDYVLSLDEETDKIVSNRVNALLDMGYKPVFELITESGRGINTTGNHPYLVRYSNNCVSFNVSVVGSTSKPSVCKTTTPSNTLSTKSEIQTSKGDSLPLSFIQPLPLNIFTTPAPVLTFSSETASIPSSSANSFGKTVKLAQVSTNALTTLDFFLSKSDISISTHECPILITNDSNSTELFKVFCETDKWIKVKELKIGDEIAVADGDSIKWEKIVSIKILEPQHVYDLMIENTHNFIANDIIAHNTYINNTLNVINGNVGIGTSSPSYPLDIYKAYTDGSGSQAGVYSIVNTTLTANNTVNGIAIGLLGDARLDAGGFNATAGTYSLRGVQGIARATGVSGTISLATGFLSVPMNTNNGTVTNMYGYSTSFSNTANGTVNNAIHYMAAASTVGNNIFGFYGNIANDSNRWNFYAAGTAPNYFAGNVGIGTNAPSSKLSLGSDVGTKLLVYDSGTLTTSYGFGIQSGYMFVDTSAADNVMVWTSAGNVGIGTTSPDSLLEVNGSFKVTSQTNDAVLLYINQSTGNVGIGTTGPGTALDIGGTGSLRVQGSAAASSGAGVELMYTGGIGYVTSYNRTTPAYNPLVLRGNDLILQEGGTEIMRIAGGNVGIGTTSPDTALEVVGAITYSDMLVSERSSFKSYKNLVDYTSSGAKGAIVINTSYPWNDSCMFKLRVDGFIYTAGEAQFEIEMGGYMFSNNLFYNTGYTSVSGRKLTSPGVRFARNNYTDTIAIILGNETDSWSYPSFIVSEFLMGYACSDNDAHASDWTIGNSSNLKAYGYKYTVPETTVLSGLVQSTVSGTNYITGGNVGIGVTSPTSLTHIRGANTPLTSSQMLYIESSDAFAIDKGGSIGFGGKYNTDGDYTQWAGIAGLKETAVNGEVGGYLAFYTQDPSTVPMAEVMRITSSGNVGIGTDNPRTALHIKDPSGTDDLYGGLRFFPTNGETPSTITGFRGAGLRLTGSESGSTYAYNAIDMNDTATYFLTGTGASLTKRVTILNNGNVGIGTTTPSEEFEVVGSGTVARFSVNAASASAIRINNTEDEFGLITDNDQFSIYDYEDAAYRLLIDTSGNVGIGTTSPDTALEVVGAITYSDMLVSERSSFKSYKNLVDYRGAAAAKGAIVINTTYPWNDTCMFKLRVDGYIYTTGDAPFEIEIGGYIYLDTFVATGYESISGRKLTSPGVRFARNNYTDTIAIILGNETDSWSYSHFIVSEFLMGYVCSLNDAYASDWTIGNDSNLKAYGYKYTVPETTVLSGLVQSTVTGDSYITGGNVGIGTTGPGAKLDILQTSGTDGLWIVKDVASNDNLLVLDNTALTGTGGSGNPADAALYIKQGGKNPAFYIQDQTGDSESFIIDKSGSVGIGTSSPTQTLNVVGTGNFTNTVYVRDLVVTNNTKTTAPTGNYSMNVTGDAWFSKGISALYFQDRTPYPKSLSEAIDAVNSMVGSEHFEERLVDYKEGIASVECINVSDDNGSVITNCEHKAERIPVFENVSVWKIDHNRLADSVKTPDGRDVSMTVSVHNEVLKYLLSFVQGKNGKELYASIEGYNETNGTFGFAPGNYTFDGNNSDLFIDDTNGRVGIGTSNPQTRLEIVDNLDVGNTILRLTSNDTMASRLSGIEFRNGTIYKGGYYRRASNDDLEIWTADGSNPRVTIQNRGNIGINTQSPDSVLEVNGSFKVTNQSDDAVLLYVNQSSGNVGVGTTDPDARLDVNGSVIVQNSLTVMQEFSALRQNINVTCFGQACQFCTYYNGTALITESPCSVNG